MRRAYVIENVVDDCNDNEDSEADTVNGSDDDGNTSDMMVTIVILTLTIMKTLRPH